MHTGSHHVLEATISATDWREWEKAQKHSVKIVGFQV